MASVIRQVPSMIGLGISRFKARSLVDKVIGVVEVTSYFVPVVSLPVWMIANARATRQLGHAALRFYSRPSEEPVASAALTLPPRPEPRTRWLIIGTVVPLALAMGILFYLLPFGDHQHERWIGFAIGETALALTFARLIRLTRVPKPAADVATPTR